MSSPHGLKVVEKVGDVSKLPRFGTMRLRLECDRVVHFYRLKGAPGIGVCVRGRQFEVLKLR